MCLNLHCNIFTYVKHTSGTWRNSWSFNEIMSCCLVGIITVVMAVMRLEMETGVNEAGKMEGGRSEHCDLGCQI